MKTNLITAAGRYDRRAIMRDAHHQRRLMSKHGWTWSRCLAFSWSKARAMRVHARPDDPDKVARVMARPTAEGIAAMYAALTGRNPSPEDMARLARRLAAQEQ